MQGHCIDLAYPFRQPEGGLLMSGKVEQTETSLEVVVVQLVAVMA